MTNDKGQPAMTLQSLMHLQTNRDGVVSRRTFLRNVAVTGAALGALSWKDAVALHAEELRKRGMACILLFMTGGPSQFETFDPKPDTKTGGPTKSMPTAGSVKYPTLGSIVASELGEPSFDLPHFVSIAGGGPLMNPANIGSGFLGMSVAPFVVADPLKMPSNVELPKSVSDGRFVRRLGVLGELE